MSKIAEKRTNEIIGEFHDGDYTDHSRHNTQWVAFKQGYDQAMQDFDERYKIAYVVTRSDLHYDDVEKVFFDKNKAEEYCKSFNKDKNSDHRNITEIEITL